MGKHQALYCIICFAAGVAATVGGMYLAGMVEFSRLTASNPVEATSPKAGTAPRSPRNEGPGAGNVAPSSSLSALAPVPAASYDAWQTGRLSADAASRAAAAQQLQTLLASSKDEEKLTGWSYIYSFWSKPAAGGRVATGEEFWTLMREINLAERIDEGAKSANAEIKKQADLAKTTFTPWGL